MSMSVTMLFSTIAMVTLMATVISITAMIITMMPVMITLSTQSVAVQRVKICGRMMAILAIIVEIMAIIVAIIMATMMAKMFTFWGSSWGSPAGKLPIIFALPHTSPSSPSPTWSSPPSSVAPQAKSSFNRSATSN